MHLFTHTCPCMGTQGISAQTLDTQAWANDLSLHLCTHIQSCIRTIAFYKHICRGIGPCVPAGLICTLASSQEGTLHPNQQSLNAHTCTTCACMYEHIINTHRHKHIVHINFMHAEMHTCPHTYPCRHAPPITL